MGDAALIDTFLSVRAVSGSLHWYEKVKVTLLSRLLVVIALVLT
jgi:hypothetical protein